MLSLRADGLAVALTRIGLGGRSRLQPLSHASRDERRHAGELVHVDIKQLGRISARGAGHRMVGHRASQRGPRTEANGRRLARQTGFEYVHVMIDDHTRLAYAEVLPTLTARCAIEFLRRAVSWFAEHGVQIKAVMSDNGAAYIAPRLPPGDSPSSDCAICASALTGPARTERQRDSSRHSPTSGPTRGSTAAQPSEPQHGPLSSSATTSDDHTAPSATQPPGRDVTNLTGQRR